ncbi:MAG: hypothetical protein V4691_10790 [Pseudomonadota bacterium]
MPAYSLSETWPWARALFVFAFGWVICAWPWLLGDLTVAGAAKSQFYPQLIFLAQSLHGGESPFWNPYIFTGFPQIADPRSLIFSPYALLAAIDENPGLRAFDAMGFALLALGGIGWIFFFRMNRWHWAGGVIAALIFCFGGATAWRMQNVNSVVTLSFLPLAFLYLELALRRNNIFYAILAGLFAALMILPRVQVSLLASYFMLARILWFFLAEPKNLERLRYSLPTVLISIFICLVLVVVPLLFTYDFLLSTTKPVPNFADVAKGSLHPAHFLTMLVPDIFASAGDSINFWGPPSIPWNDSGLNLTQNMTVLYFGSLPLLLGGLIFTRKFWGGKNMALLFVFLALMVIYALGKFTPAFQYIYAWAPGVKFFARPADAGFLISAMIAPLAGYLAHRFLAAEDNPFLLLGFGCLVLLGGFWLAWATADAQGQIITASPALLLSALTFAIGTFVLVFSRSVLRTWPQLAASALVLFVLIDLRLHNGPNIVTAAPRADYEMLDRDSGHPLVAAIDKNLTQKSLNALDRIEIGTLGAPWPNLTAGRKYYHILGDNALRLAWISETLGSPDDIGTSKKRDFLPTFPKYDSDLARILGLRLIALPKPMESVSPASDLKGFSPPRNIGDAYVYIANQAFPRIWMADNAQPLTSRAEVLANGFPQMDYLKTVLLEDAPAVLPAFTAKGTASLRLYRHTEIEIETQRTAGGYLVLADAWHPWWQATIDNQPTKIYRANMMFRAVIVPAGDHVIRFKFQPFCGLLRDMHITAGCKN